MTELVRTDRLDPRPAAEACAAPASRTVNIPADELAERIHELPPPEVCVHVADFSPHAERVCAYLGARGRPTVRFSGTRADAIQTAPAHRYRLWRPSPWVESRISSVAGRHALDLGCGVGRDAVFLAARGWNVVGVDRLPDALERAAALARRYAPNVGTVRWECADLRSWSPVGAEADRQFDLLLGVRYFDADVIQRLALQALRPGGQVLLEAFSATYREQSGHPRDPRRALEVTALPREWTALEVVAHRSDGVLAQVQLKRKA